MTIAETFDRIYAGNLWRGRESRSGPGSGLAATRHVAGWIAGLSDELGWTHVLNLGCGDDLWTPDLPGYVGVDVSRRAIARARRHHPDRTYLVGDGSDVMWSGPWSAVIVRDVLQHLPLAAGTRMIANVRASGARWLVASTYTGPSERYPADPVNVDVAAGECYCPDLTAAPFCLPTPARRTQDGFDYQDGTTIRDRSKWMGLWPLR